MVSGEQAVKKLKRKDYEALLEPMQEELVAMAQDRDAHRVRYGGLPAFRI